MAQEHSHWKTREGDVAVVDMTTSHIVNAVQRLQRQSEAKRRMADEGRESEAHADQYLEWAQGWLKIFHAELAKREYEFPQVDRRVTAADISASLADPGESDDE